MQPEGTRIGSTPDLEVLVSLHSFVGPLAPVNIIRKQKSLVTFHSCEKGGDKAEWVTIVVLEIMCIPISSGYVASWATDAGRVVQAMHTTA